MLEAIILGTAAAEGVPAMFCGCDACRAARQAGGKDIRARQSLYLPPDIVIDLGPDSMYAVQRFGLDWSGVKAVLYTHSHSDHCLPQYLEFPKYPYAHNRAAEVLEAYGNQITRRVIATIAATQPNYPLAVNYHVVKPFEPIELPNAEAVGIPSHHMADGEETLNYIVSRNGKRLLYALDTGHYDEETWDFLAKQHLDGAIFECTYGPKPATWHGHLGLPEVAAMRSRLVEQGSLAKDALCLITHFSHNGVRPHSEMEDLARPHGIQVAYDGMVIRL